jgi:hypothetical protein
VGEQRVVAVEVAKIVADWAGAGQKEWLKGSPNSRNSDLAKKWNPASAVLSCCSQRPFQPHLLLRKTGCKTPLRQLSASRFGEPSLAEEKLLEAAVDEASPCLIASLI